MNILKLLTALCMVALLSACASTSSTRLQQVRQFAAESDTLSGYAELTTRFRDTYKREQPYLTAFAEHREKLIDAQRRAAYEDFLNIQKSVALYMQTLGMLAGDAEYDFRAQISALGSGIKAWPESGIEARHVSAFTDLGRLIARMATLSSQERAVQGVLREGEAPLQSLVDAMIRLTRYYDKTNANERKIVLGLFEVEIPFAAGPRDKLLASLAKASYQSKAAEYGLIERRFALTEKYLNAIAQAHTSLLGHFDGLPVLAAAGDSANAGAPARLARLAPEAN